MKIAFVGKGGSGKTTLSSLFVRHLAAQSLPVVAVDADINQHLGTALGMPDDVAAAVPALGAHTTRLKEYLRGDNPRISSAEAMLKTTPAGRGSRLLQVNGNDPFHRDFGVMVGGTTLLATGSFDEADLGVACYHSKVAAVELYLNHLVDDADEYVVVDMTAGADAFASGLFTRFDITFLVVEPTLKGVSVYRQYKEYARDYNVALKVIGNKVQGCDDVDFLRDKVDDDLLTWLCPSEFVRALEKGRQCDFSMLEVDNQKALATIQRQVDRTPQDWGRFTSQGAQFHLKNATAWGDARVGEDLSRQIDPDFEMGPAALL